MPFLPPNQQHQITEGRVGKSKARKKTRKRRKKKQETTAAEYNGLPYWAQIKRLKMISIKIPSQNIAHLQTGPQLKQDHYQQSFTGI